MSCDCQILRELQMSCEFDTCVKFSGAANFNELQISAAIVKSCAMSNFLAQPQILLFH
jgi:hypothetical protein